MERRRVAAATVGGNGNMAVTFAAIWVEVTAQSRALLRLLRLTARRAMKETKISKRGRKALFTKAPHVHVFKLHQIPGLSKPDCKYARSSFSIAPIVPLLFLSHFAFL